MKILAIICSCVSIVSAFVSWYFYFQAKKYADHTDRLSKEIREIGRKNVIDLRDG